MQGHRKEADAVTWGREEGVLGHRWGKGKEVRGVNVGPGRQGRQAGMLSM